MQKLLVRDVDESLVRKLKRRAAAHGASTEEEHLRLLKEALTKTNAPKPSVPEYLLRTEVASEIELKLDRDVPVVNPFLASG